MGRKGVYLHSKCIFNEAIEIPGVRRIWRKKPSAAECSINSRHGLYPCVACTQAHREREKEREGQRDGVPRAPLTARAHTHSLLQHARATRFCVRPLTDRSSSSPSDPFCDFLLKSFFLSFFQIT